MKRISTLMFLLCSVTLNTNAQAPYLLKEIINGSVGGFQSSSQYAYYQHPFSVVWEKNGEIFFTAVGYSTVPNGGSYTNDMELWKSNGTQSGTVLVKDIYPGNEGSFPADFVDINGTLYFTAYNASTGRELWKTDGTTGGTQIVKELVSGGVGGFQSSAQFGYYNYPFTVVWQTGNTFYFVAADYVSAPGGPQIDNFELWKSDGTSAGTEMVKDIEPGNTSSALQDFHDVNGTLYFTANTTSSGRELWKSDGSNGGTVMVKEIIAGNAGGFYTPSQWGYYAHPFNVVWQSGGTFYFTATNYVDAPGGSTANLELWKSDGTNGGTVMVKDIEPGNTGSDLLDFHVINNTLYFTAYTSSSGRELWKSDGTTGGTVMVKEIISGAVGGFQIPVQFGYASHTFNVIWQSGGSFYFTATNYIDAPGGFTCNIELWRSDGSSGGTVMVMDINSGNEGSYPRDFTELNGTLYFTAYTNASGRELWRTDGFSNTTMVKEIMSGNVGGFQTSAQFSYDDHPFAVVWQTGNTFYFTANGNASAPGGSYTNDVELWKSDGTNGGTVLVKDINPGSAESSFPFDFTDISGTLFFTAYSNASGRELWKSDGSTGGTVLVKEIIAGNVGGFQESSQFAYYALPFHVAFNVGSFFYFVANDYATVPTGGSYENNVELWKSDGTNAGTQKVMEIYSSTTDGSYPADFANRLGRIFFTAFNDFSGRELWINDIPLSVGSDPEGFTTLQLFPVPARDWLHVSCKTDQFRTGSATLSVYSSDGRLMMQDKPETFNGMIEYELDTRELHAGIYFVCITSEAQVVRGSFVKE
jgi:ELWxxDGT repeat protein